MHEWNRTFQVDGMNVLDFRGKTVGPVCFETVGIRQTNRKNNFLVWFSRHILDFGAERQSFFCTQNVWIKKEKEKKQKNSLKLSQCANNEVCKSIGITNVKEESTKKSRGRPSHSQK